LMQGLADGYFVVPYTLANYIASTSIKPVSPQVGEFSDCASDVQKRIDKLFAVKGPKPTTDFHRRLGRMMWNDVGMSRTKDGTQKVIGSIGKLRQEFWSELRVPGDAHNANTSLEHAARVADFLEFAEIVALDANARDESCGGHFREEFQTPENEARRDDEKFSHVAVFEYQGENKPVIRNQEELKFEYVKPSQRSYK